MDKKHKFYEEWLKILDGGGKLKVVGEEPMMRRDM